MNVKIIVVVMLVFSMFMISPAASSEEKQMSSPALGVGFHGSMIGNEMPTLYTWKPKMDENNPVTTLEHPGTGIYSGFVLITPARIAGEPIRTIGEPTRTIGEPTRTIGEPIEESINMSPRDKRVAAWRATHSN